MGGSAYFPMVVKHIPTETLTQACVVSKKGPSLIGHMAPDHSTSYLEQFDLSIVANHVEILSYDRLRYTYVYIYIIYNIYVASVAKFRLATEPWGKEHTRQHWAFEYRLR